jgi:acetyl-CoA carboxylase biotin carboxyl carrier protein
MTRVSQALNSLTEDEVRQIVRLVELLDRSTFDYLQLESGSLKVTIGKGSMPHAAIAVPAAPVAATATAAPVVAAPPAVSTSAPPAAVPVAAVRHESPASEGTAAIEALTMGRFYAKPEPGAAPFVSVGTVVTADTTVALIEVMKVFSAVPAGVAGVITEICVQDAEFVEYRQVLFRVRPV